MLKMSIVSPSVATAKYLALWLNETFLVLLSDLFEYDRWQMNSGNSSICTKESSEVVATRLLSNENAKSLILPQWLFITPSGIYSNV